MRFVSATALALAGAMSIAQLHAHQATTTPAPPKPATMNMQDTSRKVAGGGISAPGWKGKVDANEAAKGAKIEDSKVALKGSEIQINNGPAAIYWNPADKAAGPYGDGKFIVRGFGPAPFRVTGAGGGRGTASEAVHKAETGASVTQEVAWVVTADKAECKINGTVVASYPKADLVAPGKLESLDGIAGLRVAHNVDVNVNGFKVTKQ